MGENGEFILWGIGKTDWEIPHFSPLVPPNFRSHFSGKTAGTC